MPIICVWPWRSHSDGGDSLLSSTFGDDLNEKVPAEFKSPHNGAMRKCDSLGPRVLLSVVVLHPPPPSLPGDKVLSFNSPSLLKSRSVGRLACCPSGIEGDEWKCIYTPGQISWRSAEKNTTVRRRGPSSKQKRNSATDDS